MFLTLYYTYIISKIFVFDTLPQSPEYLKNKNKNSIFKAKIFQFSKYFLGVLYSFLNNRETWIIGMYRGTKIQEESFNDFLMASLFWYKSRWKPWFSADYIGNMQ